VFFTRLIAVLLLLCTALSSPVRAERTVAVPDWHAVAAMQSSDRRANVAEEAAPLRGGASVDSSLWARYYDSGTKALYKRCFGEAENRLHKAIQEVSKYGGADARVVKTKIALGQTYSAVEHYAQSERLFNEALSAAKRTFGEQSSEVADSLHGLALVNIVKGKFAVAEKQAREAVEIRQKLGAGNEHKAGAAMSVLASALARQGWNEEAETFYKKAVELMQKSEMPLDFELSDTLRTKGLWLQAQGRMPEAMPCFHRAFQIKEQATKYDQTAATGGAVTMHWDRGSSEARVLNEGKYPVEYVNVNGLRVACMVVDLGFRIGALISIRNNTMKSQEIGVGPVFLDEVSPKPQRFPPVKLDHSLRITEERAFDWLTRNQPFVINMLITRKTAGYLDNGLPDIEHELGANVFGMYGEWGEKPLEQNGRHYGHTKTEALAEGEKTQSQFIRSLDFRPTVLGPGESRTGLLFFNNPIFQEAILQLIIGNTTFKFPFHAPPRHSQI
jgi:tetratricopeptide (TPR) repeat protein